MSFSRLFGILFLTIAFLTGSSFAAKNNSGKVRYTVGDATLQKKGKGDWAPVRMGNKVAQNDNIRTLLEAQVIISLPDGSSLTINENTFVAMSELMSEDGINRTTVDIKNGKVNFDVQKQANKDSHFKFKTGTATAAIRGTEGIAGTTAKGKFFAALNQGRLEIESSSGQKITINEKQAVIPVKGDSLIVLSVNSKVTSKFFDKIDEILTHSDSIAVDSIINQISQFDSLNSKRAQELKDSLQCTFSTLPDTTESSKHTIKVNCPEGVTIELNGERKKSSGSELSFEPQWAASLIGEKKFAIGCYYGEYSFNCGHLSTYYKLAETNQDSIPSADSTNASLTITTSSPIKVRSTDLWKDTSPIRVCSPASVTIEGTFDPSDSNATLFVTLGKFTSENLVRNSVNGRFSTTINISDKIGNWDVNEATVTYKSSKNQTQTKMIPIHVDKTCKDVNLKAPKIHITTVPPHSSKCPVIVEVKNLEGDQAIYKTITDGQDGKEIHLKNNKRFKEYLTGGHHHYEFTATDQAGNTASVKKSLDCYTSLPRAAIRIKDGTYERLRVPPPPGKIKKSLYRNLRFSVTGLPSNDYTYIKEITISQSNKSETTRYTESDLISNSIEQQIEVFHGTTTKVNIVVKLKNGESLRAEKIYEVR